MKLLNIGDKVKIKAEMEYANTCIVNIEELKKKVLTVCAVSEAREDGSYRVRVCDQMWSLNSEWLELVEDKESTKFEAFLREVANQKSFSYGDEWACLDDIVHSRSIGDETFDKAVAKLVDFYRAFEPMPKSEKKQFTMAELRDIVGEDFEIVD